MKNRTKPLAIGLAATLAASLFTATAAADEILEQIDLGRELYQEDDYAGAITELEFAIKDLRKKVNEMVGETFPDAADGWTAAEVQSNSGGGMLGAAAGTVLTRKYSEEGGKGQMEATLAIDSPMVQGMAAMFNNPALMASQPNVERIRIGRDSAFVKWQKERNNAEITYMLDGRILLQVKGRNLASPDPAVALLKSWDMDELRGRTSR